MNEKKSEKKYFQKREIEKRENFLFCFLIIIIQYVWVWPFKQYTEVTIEPQIFKKKKRKCFYIFNFVLGLVSSQAWKSLSRSFPLVKETNLDHPGLLNLPEFICFFFFYIFVLEPVNPEN
jgi:hypothetical protein